MLDERESNSPVKVQFRWAPPQDASRIQELYRQLVADPNINVTTAGIENLRGNRNNYLVVGEMTERVVATAFLILCNDVMYGDQPFAVLENVVVDRDFRKCGVGSAMLSWIKDFCGIHRCTKIMLLSSSNRAEAHAFFETCGYRGNIKRGFVNYINR